jgi:hypothetical protein
VPQSLSSHDEDAGKYDRPANNGGLANMEAE